MEESKAVTSGSGPGTIIGQVDNLNFGPREKWRILRNVIVVSIAFMIHFTAFTGTSNLQSSIHVDAGLGTASLAAVYGSLVLSDLFLPALIIGWVGCKWTVAICLTSYMPFLVAQFAPSFGTLIPAALSVGFGGGPLWCAKSTYLSVLAAAYTKVTGAEKDALLVRFFGLFVMIFQFAQIWGNLISSLVLSAGNPNEIVKVNSTLLEFCGARFLPSNKATAENANLETPSKQKIYTLTSIYLVCMAGAVLIVILFLDSLKRYEPDRQAGGEGMHGFQLLATTLKLLKERWQIFMLPITIFLGFSQAFIGAEYTAAFVSCAWGISNIGYVMIFYGICNASSAVVLGYLAKITGRLPIVCAGAILHTSILIGLLIWKPNPYEHFMYFLFSGGWGIVDGVWSVQINAYCGILFPGREEAAYSNYHLWESLGYIVAFSYSSFVRTDAKIYIILSVMWTGMAGYIITEISYKRSKKEATS